MKKKIIKLNNDEQKILKEYENNEYESVPNLTKEIKKYSKYAKATVKKKTISIRIIERDHKQYSPLTDGIPYQTLIAS